MTPVVLQQALPAAVLRATWSWPVEIFDEQCGGVQTPADLTSATATLWLTSHTAPALAVSIVGAISDGGLVLFTATPQQVDAWGARIFEVELTLEYPDEVQSLVISTLPVFAGPHARQDNPAQRPQTPIGGVSAPVVRLLRADNGAARIVRVDRVVVGARTAREIAFDDTLTMLGVDNVQDAIVALYALIGSVPPPDPDPVAFWTSNPGLLGAFA